MYLAYLDPGSGGMLAAAVVAGFAGAMVAVKVWWRRMLNKFRRSGPADGQQPVAGEAPAAAGESAVTGEPAAAEDPVPAETPARADRDR